MRLSTEDHECDRRQIAVATAAVASGELAAIRMQTEAVTVWRHGHCNAPGHNTLFTVAGRHPVWQTRSSKASMRQAIRQCAHSCGSEHEAIRIPWARHWPGALCTVCSAQPSLDPVGDIWERYRTKTPFPTTCAAFFRLKICINNKMDIFLDQTMRRLVTNEPSLPDRISVIATTTPTRRVQSMTVLTQSMNPN